MSIRRLPPLLVNQIAAGEVIERPASVVKELVENAVDAGARRIDVTIEQGGKELIVVADDGHGMPFDDLALAVAPHATSKIESAEDLDAIATMGFRGEALASIASISRMTLLSRPHEVDGAGLIEAEGNDVQPVRPSSGAPGTTVTVRNLFFNTPARRKFLKTDQTETGRVNEVVEGIALAHPGIAFTLTVDGRKRLDVSAETTPRRRVVSICGRELESELLEFDVHERGMRIWGMAGRPGIARATAKHQRVYLNGRPIHDRSISHAVKEAYRGLIEPGRYPTIVLFMSVDPAEVDVNVHPAKAEVRFRHQGVIHGAVLNAIRSALRSADLTSAVEFARDDAGPSLAVPLPPVPEFGAGRNAGGGAETPADAADRSTAGAFVDYFRRLDPKQKGFVYSEMKQALSREAPEVLESEVAAARERAEPGSLPAVRTVDDILQVHSSFIVTQDEEGLVIIDQHALHERVMFEQLRQRIEQGNLESQRLLMPETIHIHREQIEALEGMQSLLSRLGIEAELIGPSDIAIHAFTSLLFERGVTPAVFMQELLGRAAREGLSNDPEAALHEVLDMMACKAAVKAGDRLSTEELTELMRHRQQVERSSNCPHGRPTSLRLSIRDLERQFGRR